MVDTSVFHKQRSFGDLMKLEEDFHLKKQQAVQQAQLGGLQMQKLQKEIETGVSTNDPATIRIANEIQAALKAGDMERANLLHQVHKTMDKGINPYGQTFQYSQPIMGGDPLAASQNAIGQRQQEIGINPYDDIGVAPMQLADVERAVGYQPQAIPGYGEAVGSISATKKGMEQQAAKNVDLRMNPQIERETQIAGAQGKNIGEKQTDFSGRIARMPQLFNTVEKLSGLGKLATYTVAGQARDEITRQLGFDVPDSAVARTEYISMVDNEILPLLRETFGAQFTQKEGESLKATLGDPNKAPMEKDAVLRSFIRTKMLSTNTLARELGQPEPFGAEEMSAVSSRIGGRKEAPSALDQAETEFQNKKTPRLKYNPATGSFE